MRRSRSIPAQPVCCPGWTAPAQAGPGTAEKELYKSLPPRSALRGTAELPPARPGSTAGGRGNRGGTKATSWQTPPAPQRAKTGLAGSRGRDPLRVPSGAAARSRHRRGSRRERPPHPPEMAAGPAAPARERPPPAPSLPRGSGSAGRGRRGTGRDGSAPGEAAGCGRGSRRVPAPRGAAAPSIPYLWPAGGCAQPPAPPSSRPVPPPRPAGAGWAGCARGRRTGAVPAPAPDGAGREPS